MIWWFMNKNEWKFMKIRFSLHSEACWNLHFRCEFKYRQSLLAFRKNVKTYIILKTPEREKIQILGYEKKERWEPLSSLANTKIYLEERKDCKQYRTVKYSNKAKRVHWNQPSRVQPNSTQSTTNDQEIRENASSEGSNFALRFTISVTFDRWGNDWFLDS